MPVSEIVSFANLASLSHLERKQDGVWIGMQCNSQPPLFLQTPPGASSRGQDQIPALGLPSLHLAEEKGASLKVTGKRLLTQAHTVNKEKPGF